METISASNRQRGTIIFLSALMVLCLIPMATATIEITPPLNISVFTPYNITASIPEAGEKTIRATTVNGEGDLLPTNYYVNGTPIWDNRTYPLLSGGGDSYYRHFYPDHLYPEIMFADSNVTWENEPDNYPLWRGQYHIMKFENPFSVDTNMSFWIEFNAVPVSASSPPSLDLLVYLIGNGEDISYFQTDWREGINTIQVGSVNRNTPFHHVHSPNSSHHLIALSTNSSGLINGLNISGNFWVVLYSNAPSITRGWNLRYHSSLIADNNAHWYTGVFNTWTTTHRNGAPDVHIHLARNETIVDTVNATILLDGAYHSSKLFSFGELPNLPPNPSVFNSIATPASKTVNITWQPATDPNNDLLVYNVSIVDSNGNVLIIGVNETNAWLLWNTSDVADGFYNIVVNVSDGELTAEWNYFDQFGYYIQVKNTPDPSQISLVVIFLLGVIPVVIVFGTISVIMSFLGIELFSKDSL